MFDDIIKNKCRNCPDKKCDCDSEEIHYTCIGCGKPIKVGQHCPTCNPVDLGAKKNIQDAYKKFIEAVSKKGL